jgi:RND family efflux transporter MFP subunit
MPEKSIRQRIVQVILPLVVLAAGAGAGAVIINSKPALEENRSTSVLRSVNAVVASAGHTAIIVGSQGTVEARQQISLVPQVSGTLTWVADNFVNGGAFAAGEVMLQIDDRDYRLAVTGAEAAVAEARQQLAMVQAQAEQAQADWQLLQRNGSKRTEPTALALFKPQLAGAEARVLSAEAELQKARLMLERTRILAPFSGIITDKQVDLGQFVTAGLQLGSLVSNDVLEVRLALPERELGKLELDKLQDPGAGLSVRVQGLTGSDSGVWQGRIVRTEGLLDARTRNLVLVAQFSGHQRFADNGAALTIGQFVRAEIEGRVVPEVFRLPRTALHNARSVFVIDPEQRLREREVEVLEIHEDHILVAAGLSAGEMVSISPLTSSVEGQNVQTILNDGVM